jgi:glycosyltransferase involved in cell wall biosynthesis
LFFVWREGAELLNNIKFEKYICYKNVREEWLSLLESNYADITFDDFQTPNFDIVDRMGNCGFVISGRYHGIVAAIQRGLPFIAIDICPKIRALVEECGLSEYCVKVSEIDKVQYLIDCAKCRVNEIRIKEREYINKANICLLKQMLKIKQIIYANAYKYRLLHYGSYWMGENDVVNVMSDDLKTIANIKKINLNAYSLQIDNRIASISKTPNGSITVLNTSRIISDIEEYNPDAIILNSGGLCMQKELINYLKEKKVVSIGISLSDPDVYPYNGKVYSKEFDLFYTNSKWSLLNQYENCKNIKLLPFAASTTHHYFMPNIEKKYDVVIVGHARDDRIKVVKKLSKVCNIGLYGGGWENGLGIVNGIEQVRAINSGKMYLSFSHTNSGYENVKVGLFEAMACRQLVLTSYMEELSDYFEIGKEIVCYKDDEELLFLVDYYLHNEAERERIINAGYLRFMKCHTYIQRWCNVIEDIDALYTRK